MIVFGFIVFAVACVIVAINVDPFRRRSTWHEAPFPRQYMMRRYVDGCWQYRPMMDEEAADIQSSNAW